jgi:putative spermidine/putrescine transport system ATP-binding protein
VRVRLRGEIREIQRRLGITTIFVTHDQEEALSISDRVVVMNAGIADRWARPSRSTHQPATPFVAGFVGTLTPIEVTVIDPVVGTVMSGGLTMNRGAGCWARRRCPRCPSRSGPKAGAAGREAGREIVLPATARGGGVQGSVIPHPGQAGGAELPARHPQPARSRRLSRRAVEISFSGATSIVIGA